MRVYCEACDCVCNSEGLCDVESISLDEDCQCRDYENYRKAKEWQSPFWKRMLDKDSNNRICRVRYYGKRIEVNERVFFVESREKYAILTDEITGMSAGSFDNIQKNFDRVVEAARKVDVPLLELPIAIYDENSRIFHYEDERR